MNLLQVVCFGMYYSIFNKFKYRVTNKLGKPLYPASICSTVKYGIEVYENCSVQNINTVQFTQNKLWKLILHKDRTTHTDEIHKIMNILRAKDI